MVTLYGWKVALLFICGRYLDAVGEFFCLLILIVDFTILSYNITFSTP
jgi:hypothetical protein